ncbi:MAG: hypothetical protein ABR499_10870 [Gemmatimonadaceae bacterium]
MMLHLRRATVALTVCVVAACGDNSTGLRQGEFVGMQVVAGGDATDTVDHRFTQALVVEVRDERGDPIVDHPIRFSTVPVDPERPFGGYTALVSSPERNEFGIFASDRTDSRGRARVLVQLGRKAGPALVIITDPDHATADTATFTVQPGQGVAVLASPADTAVYVGRTVTLRSAVADRWSNPRTDPVTHTVVGSAVTVSGSTMSAVALGVAMVVTTAGTMADTTNVTVPPEGTLAAFTFQGLATFNTDGSGFRVLASDVVFSGVTTAWSPSGAEVAFDRSCCGGIQVVNLASGARTTVTPANSTALYPEFSRDGQWVYYSRGFWRLHRVHPDGTGDEQVPMLTPVSDGAPSFSPSGAQLVYVRITGGSQDQLWMLDVASGASTNLNVLGHTPAWSPTGAQIAFLSLSDGSGIKVMNPDGTGVRPVTTSGAYGFGLDWSPDGQWIVARSTSRDRIELINATSGEVIPLPYTRGYNGPSWKP